MLKNDCGADFLPMRLAAVIVTVLILLASTVAYSLEVAGQSSKVAARACAARIAAVATVEYVDGCPDHGAGTWMDLTVPASVRKIVFGATTPEASEEDAGGTYLIQYADGSSETYFTGLPLGSGSPSCKGSPLVLYPGRYAIGIRTETVDGRPMALVYAEAA